MPPQAEIVARRAKHPQNLPRKTGGRPGLTRKFSDAGRWDELAAKYLPRYRLPGWDTPCHPVAMRWWLKRLGMSERAYEKATATSLEDFIRLNPGWPLRAWIGTVLEMKAP
jgi:hypothetical protein